MKSAEVRTKQLWETQVPWANLPDCCPGRAFIRSQSSTVIDRDRGFRRPLVRYDKPNPRRLQHLVVNCDYSSTKCGYVQSRDRSVDHILLFIPRFELHGHFLCFKLSCKRADLAPEKRKRYTPWGCENPTQTHTRRRILVRNDNGLAILWCTDMKAGNDVRIHSPVFDARSGRQAWFGTPQLEYQIVALVRLNRPPTNAVSRLPCCEQIKRMTHLPRARQDPVHGD